MLICSWSTLSVHVFKSAAALASNRHTKHVTCQPRGHVFIISGRCSCSTLRQNIATDITRGNTDRTEPDDCAWHVLEPRTQCVRQCMSRATFGISTCNNSHLKLLYACRLSMPTYTSDKHRTQATDYQNGNNAWVAHAHAVSAPQEVWSEVQQHQDNQAAQAVVLHHSTSLSRAIGLSGDG